MISDDRRSDTDRTKRARLELVEEHVLAENDHDIGRLMATFGAAPRFDDEPFGDHHVGRAAVAANYEQLLQGIPDLHIDVTHRYIAEASIILEVVITGTHTGRWRCLPGTGNPLAFPVCAIFTFDDQHMLAGERIYYDRATVLRQLGVFHEPDRWIGRLLMPLTHHVAISRAMLRTIRAP